jgi:hypothetical protein
VHTNPPLVSWTKLESYPPPHRIVEILHLPINFHPHLIRILTFEENHVPKPKHSNDNDSLDYEAHSASLPKLSLILA